MADRGGEGMEEVKYHVLEMWGWDCPECGYWNETGDDPIHANTLRCDVCDGEFVPVPE